MFDQGLRTVHVTGVLGTGKNQASGNFRAVIQLSDGSRLGLEAEASVLSGLELAIRNHLADQSYAAEGGPFVAQPLLLDSCQPFAHADGRVGMILEIEHMKLPVLIPLSGIPTLLEGINRMIQLATAQVKVTTN